MSSVLEIWDPNVGEKRHDPRLRKISLDEVSLEVLGAFGDDAIPASYLSTASLWPGWAKLGKVSRKAVKNSITNLVNAGLLRDTGIKHRETTSRILQVSPRGALVLRKHREYVEALEGGLSKTA